MNGRPSAGDQLREIDRQLMARKDELRRQRETTDAFVVTLALACLVFWLFWLTLKLAKAGLL